MYTYNKYNKSRELLLLLCLRGGQLRFLAGAIFVFYSIFRGIEDFDGEALVLGEIYLFILWSLVLTLDLFSHLTLKKHLFL